MTRQFVLFGRSSPLLNAQTVQLVSGYFRDTLQEFSEFALLVRPPRLRYLRFHMECLEFFYPRLAPGEIMLLDEYNDPPWPGCNKAVDEFLNGKPRHWR